MAEGVETREQWQFLLALGCQNFQGHLFGRAVPPDELQLHGQTLAALVD
ncbi:MAG: hypothetical protein WBI20_05340 [Burkholderiaceae bacterium]